MCSIARALEIVGERWTLLIIRDALLGLRRFDEFRDSLGIARNTLTDRLNRLVEHGIFERVRYQERPDRYEYTLTPAGQELSVPLLALMHWGDRHLAGADGPPRLTAHAGCGGPVVEQVACTGCGQAVAPHEVTTRLRSAVTGG
ncbi:winged helix-turn-helix transcriptional regulator [Pseudonocardia sp. H11422]|uniref:winged helix-turn-helix transcriptional regulator n=1 Tax=Pseudonocardia sp. H11422 TaxID=2835866 RepID=UPI001BDCB01C|nr:helix-turn-helix domain-containing protein [Pseudonocardia sp. H11422]